jgi:hypothetical protein
VSARRRGTNTAAQFRDETRVLQERWLNIVVRSRNKRQPTLVKKGAETRQNAKVAIREGFGVVKIRRDDSNGRSAREMDRASNASSLDDLPSLHILKPDPAASKNRDTSAGVS